MTANIEEKHLIIEKPLSLKNALFLNFKINREDWNYYKLQDGAVLKGRFILKSVLIEGKLEDIITQVKLGEKPRLRLSYVADNIYAIEAPTELRGPPDTKRYTAEDLRQAITQKDVDYETVRESWNFYQLDNGMVLKVKLSPSVVSKTSKFEQGGMPIYLVESSLEMKIEFPDDIQKALDAMKQNNLGDSRSTNVK